MSSVSTSSSPAPNSHKISTTEEAAAAAVAVKLGDMALVPNPVVTEDPLFAEVDMGADTSGPTVRATIVQAATVFYDTPATLGNWFPLYLHSCMNLVLGLNSLFIHLSKIRTFSEKLCQNA